MQAEQEKQQAEDAQPSSTLGLTTSYVAATIGRSFMRRRGIAAMLAGALSLLMSLIFVAPSVIESVTSDTSNGIAIMLFAVLGAPFFSLWAILGIYAGLPSSQRSSLSTVGTFLLAAASLPWLSLFGFVVISLLGIGVFSQKSSVQRLMLIVACLGLMMLLFDLLVPNTAIDTHMALVAAIPYNLSMIVLGWALRIKDRMTYSKRLPY